jgi:hypothetical protein
MLFCNDCIVSRKLWKPFVNLFRHGIGIYNDGFHVQGLIEVLFPRMIHWCKWEITVKKLFYNRGMERRPCLVSFGRFESSKGKGLLGRRILGWRSHQMSFMKISSRKEKERELTSSGVARKDRGKRLWDQSFPRCH